METLDKSASDLRPVRNFMLLAALNGTIIGLVGVAAPLFALFLHASTFEIGMVTGVLPLGIGFMSIPIGMAIDRFGARRVFAAGSALGGIAFFLVSRSTSPGWLILATIIASPAVPMHFLSIQSDFFHYLNVAGNRKAGWIRATQMGGSVALGPLLGSVLIGFLDYSTLYVLVAVSFVLMLLLGRKVLTGRAEALARRSSHHERPVLEQLRTLFGHREIAETSLIAFATSGATAFYGAFIMIIAIEQFHLSEEAAAPLLSAQGVSYIGALFFLGGALETLGQRAYYRTAYAVAVAGLVLLGFAQALPALWLGAILLGLGLGMVAVANVVRQAAVSHQLGRGNVAGAGNPPAALGAWAGAFVGGALGGWIGLQNVFLAFIGSFAVLSWFELPRRTREDIRALIAAGFEASVPRFRRLGDLALGAARRLSE
jgi:MFS family permease